MMKKRLYPVVGMGIFATLVASLLGTTTISMGLVMGLMVFALMVASTLQAILTKENDAQVQAASTTIIGLVMAILGHVALSFTGLGNLLAGSAVAITGFAAVIGLVTYAVATFIGQTASGKMTAKRQSTFSKWTKGLLAVSTTATLVHMMAIDFLRENVVFMGLVTLYFAVTIAAFVYVNSKQKATA
ncbi:hypothetical protein [Aerococcus urinaeequi]|uniref:hypothetical protein n=1 Tax=Aerococcus urinaeequi TaxID=51665 RepID=UPI000B061D46|nr:hypothetical protein [Aerococcus urinaeequi]